MKNTFLFWGSLLVFAVPGWANALTWPSGASVGTPTYGGTGCPAGSGLVELSPENGTLKFFLDGFQVEAGGSGGKRLDRKSCNFAVPVSIPKGYSVGILTTEFEGSVSLPDGGRGSFSVESFFAGSQGPVSKREFEGPRSEHFVFNSDSSEEGMMWTACGQESTTVRVNASVLVQTNSNNDLAQAGVRNRDASTTKVTFIHHFHWKRCGEQPAPQPDPAPSSSPVPMPAPSPLPDPEPVSSVHVRFFNSIFCMGKVISEGDLFAGVDMVAQCRMLPALRKGKVWSMKVGDKCKSMWATNLVSACSKVKPPLVPFAQRVVFIAGSASCRGRVVAAGYLDRLEDRGTQCKSLQTLHEQPVNSIEVDGDCRPVGNKDFLSSCLDIQ